MIDITELIEKSWMNNILNQYKDTISGCDYDDDDKIIGYIRSSSEVINFLKRNYQEKYPININSNTIYIIYGDMTYKLAFDFELLYKKTKQLTIKDLKYLIRKKKLREMMREDNIEGNLTKKN